MNIHSDKPIWGYIYPDLMDKDKVIFAYKTGVTQAGGAKIIGCCERTFRKALRYHDIRPPVMSPPDNVKEIFENGTINRK